MGFASNYLRAEKQKWRKEGRPALLTAESVASGGEGDRVTTLSPVLYMSEVFHDWGGEEKKKKTSIFQSPVRNKTGEKNTIHT